MTVLRPPLPREHGSWAMLLVPMLLGLILAPSWHWRALLLALAAVGYFLARHPLVTLVKTRRRATADRGYLWRWAAFYGSVTALAGSWLMLVHSLWWLGLMALIGGLLLGFHLWLVTRRQERSTGGELVGIAGLALGAPMAYYVASGVLDQTAALLWLVNFLYFGGTVFYIRLKVRQQPRLAPPSRAGTRLVRARACLTYQTAVLTLVIALVALQQAPLLAPLAFVPATLKALHGAWRWQDRQSLSLVRLGVTEIVHAITFTMLLIVAFVY